MDKIIIPTPKKIGEENGRGKSIFTTSGTYRMDGGDFLSPCFEEESLRLWKAPLQGPRSSDEALARQVSGDRLSQPPEVFSNDRRNRNGITESPTSPSRWRPFLTFCAIVDVTRASLPRGLADVPGGVSSAGKLSRTRGTHRASRQCGSSGVPGDGSCN